LVPVPVRAQLGGVVSRGTGVFVAVRVLVRVRVGVGVLVDRSAGQAQFDVPLIALWDVSIPSYLPQECPQCAQVIPLVKPGTTPAPAMHV